MGREKNNRKELDNEAKVVLKNIRISPQKLNLVAQMIRKETASKAKNDAHTASRSLKSVESERDALRATLKKAADDTARAKAELEAVRHLGAESKLAGDAALRELERLRDERARRHAREHDHAMAAGLARSELDAARSRQAYPQYGNRCLHGRFGSVAGRCAPRCSNPNKTPRLHRFPAGCTPYCSGGE